MNTKFIIRILLISTLCMSFMNTYAQRHHHKKGHKHNPHYRYANLPRWGKAYKVAPKGALLFNHAGIKFHYHSGIFYKTAGSSYIIVKAPIGIRVKTLPDAKIKFVLNGRKYFYYYGTFYVRADDDSDFITVEPPVGARVDALPDGYKEVEIKGEEYFEFEGTYYKAITKDDEEWYEVVSLK